MKNENERLGMHIKGGLNGQRGNPIDAADEGVFVSKINSSGAARRDGRLKVCETCKAIKIRLHFKSILPQNIGQRNIGAQCGKAAHEQFALWKKFEYFLNDAVVHVHGQPFCTRPEYKVEKKMTTEMKIII